MPTLIDHPLGRFWVWPDSVGRDLQRGGFWDEHLRPAMDAADPSGWALDLGASTGWFTVYLARRFAHVLAVEAHPTTYRLLLQTLAMNHLLGGGVVTPMWVAAYDRPATLRMATEAEIGWTLPSYVHLDGAVCASGVAFRPDGIQPDHLQVAALPVDDLVPPTARVTLIKVDVQGCDLRALHGLSKTIARCRPPVLFEYEAISQDWHGDGLEAYLAFFAEREYTVAQVHPSFQDYLAVPR